MYVLEAPEKGAAIPDVRIPKGGLRLMLAFIPPARGGRTTKVMIAQELNGRVEGGSTYVLPRPARGGGARARRKRS